MFLQARLKLTLLYVLIVAVIVCGFSVFLYQNIRSNLRESSQDDFADTHHQQAFIERTLGATENGIILADLVIILLAAGLSYVLAGKTLEPIQRSVEAQKVFAANASHELRTPLAVMRNDIEVLSRNKYPAKENIEATLKSNLEEITRMSGIVEDLLLLARSDNQKSPEFSYVDITKLLQTVTDKMRPLAESKSLTLTYDSAGPLMVNGSPSHLERFVLNILQNSIEHTPRGGRVSITMTEKTREVFIQFSDTGTGIDAKDLSSVFSRFYKGEASTGTGLGLSIVKEIIDQHRGKISIESAKGKGTTVSVHLPLC